jgi:hypothetical protein
MFGGGRATGGPVKPGGFYRVNELGPELLTMHGATYLMASAAGQVTPLISSIPPSLRGVVQQAANDTASGNISDRVGNVIPLPTAANRGASPAQAGTVNNQTITITINAAQGMDERAIAEAVARKLREVERANAVKQRGRMYD